MTKVAQITSRLIRQSTPFQFGLSLIGIPSLEPAVILPAAVGQTSAPTFCVPAGFAQKVAFAHKVPVRGDWRVVGQFEKTWIVRQSTDD